MNRSGSRVPSPFTVTLLIGLLSLIWGSTWLVIRGGLQDLPPFTAAGTRFLFAGLLMVAAAPKLRRAEGGEPPTFDLVLAMGVLNFGASYGVVYWAETVLPSGLVSLLWASYPVMVAVGGHFFVPGERLAVRQWAGTLVALLGIVFLFATDLRKAGPEAVPTGLLLLASPFLSMIGNLYVKRFGGHVSSVLLNRNGLLVGAALLLATAFLTERHEEVRWTAAALGSVAYLTIVGTVVAFSVYFWLLRFAPAYKLSQIAYIVPPIALTLGAVVGGETLGTMTIAGALLILAGVVLVLRRGR